MTREARNAYVMDCIPWMAGVVGRFAKHRTLPASVDVDDLLQEAVLAVLLAAERYQPGRGASFRTFVDARVRGSCIDTYRAARWISRPRCTASRAVRLEPLEAACDVQQAEPDDDFDIWRRRRVRYLWQTLPARERAVLAAEAIGYTRVDVARRLHVVPQRVSQLATRAKRLLRRAS